MNKPEVLVPQQSLELLKILVKIVSQVVAVLSNKQDALVGELFCRHVELSHVVDKEIVFDRSIHF